MDFRGPEQADFSNVAAINHEFLLHLQSSRGAALRQQLPSTPRAAIVDLTGLQIERLSTTPFLLLSVREHDTTFWQRLADDDPTGDLLPGDDCTPASSQLATTSLAFLWQLAQRNPYAARLVSGATLSWCEQLAEWTLLRLLQRMACRSDLLMPRRANDSGFWNKLLGPGLSSEQNVRRAARLSSLQSILTADPRERHRPMRAAACSTLAPSLSIADKSKGL